MILMTEIPDSFIQWLHEQVENSRYSQSEASRRAGLNQNAISDIVNGKTREISLHLAKGLGRVFNTSTEEVLRLSGGLPPLPPATKEEREVLAVLRDLSPEARAVIVQIIRSLKSTSNLLQSTGQSAIIASNSPPPNLPTLDDEIRRFLIDFPELRSIMEGAQEHLSDVAIRALMANVEIVVSNPAERLRFIEFHKELSAVFDALATTA